MNHNERLTFCKRCKNKKFDSKLGIVCGLTDQRPNFDNSCEHFDENSESKKYTNFKKQNQIKYPALLVISNALNIFGWITILISIGFSIYNLSVNLNAESIFPSLIVLILGCFSGILSIAIGEGIKVIIDIEHNTRKGY